ncbi:MAG: right-handed parallel beta-helix repeat-containing protein [Armatimonadetes bacterium]|nr:right-handed parallel beta-helix repeat-containing protein [Armatimonadota bacterium]
MACPITYAAYPGEKPVISGGRRISGWKRGEGHLWTAEVSEVKAGKARNEQARHEQWSFRQLFVNGVERKRPRLPKDGYHAVAGPIVPEKWDDPQNAKAFHFKAGDINKSWTNLKDVEVVVLQYWTEARLRIAEVDDQTSTVTFTGSSWRPLTWSKGYVVENVCEGLDAPGEWYLNRKTGVLTYWPLPGEDMTKAEVIAPVAEQLVRIEGDVEAGKFVEHVALRGLSFRYANAPLPDAGHAYPQAEVGVRAAIHAEGAKHCSFEDNEVWQVGQWGLELSWGCQDNRIVGNRIHDVGAGGIKIGEESNREKDADEACRTVITDNEVYDGNKVYMGAPAIWIGQSGGNLIAHNEIHGAWEWAISVGWNWEYLPPNRARDNVVEYNHIHHLGESVLGTHAAIYCLGLSPGTVLRHNLIHHVSGGGYGIILDQGCAGVLVENNVVHHTDGGWCSNFHCIGNTIMNNVFALTRQAAMHRYGDSPPAGYNLSNCNICCRNIFYWKEGKLEERDDWLDFGTVQDWNLYFDARGEPVKFLRYSFDEWKAKGLDRSSILADPLFVDPDNGNLNLKPESPAFKLGFRPIDLSGNGPRRGGGK